MPCAPTNPSVDELPHPNEAGRGFDANNLVNFYLKVGFIMSMIYQ
jgi:hypothetical protein